MLLFEEPERLERSDLLDLDDPDRLERLVLDLLLLDEPMKLSICLFVHFWRGEDLMYKERGIYQIFISCRCQMNTLIHTIYYNLNLPIQVHEAEELPLHKHWQIIMWRRLEGTSFLF